VIPQELPRLSRERCAAAAVTTQRQIFVMGGCDEESIAAWICGGSTVLWRSW